MSSSSAFTTLLTAAHYHNMNQIFEAQHPRNPRGEFTNKTMAESSGVLLMTPPADYGMPTPELNREVEEKIAEAAAAAPAQVFVDYNESLEEWSDPSVLNSVFSGEEPPEWNEQLIDSLEDRYQGGYGGLSERDVAIYTTHSWSPDFLDEVAQWDGGYEDNVELTQYASDEEIGAMIGEFMEDHGVERWELAPSPDLHEYLADLAHNTPDQLVSVTLSDDIGSAMDHEFYEGEKEWDTSDDEKREFITRSLAPLGITLTDEQMSELIDNGPWDGRHEGMSVEIMFRAAPSDFVRTGVHDRHVHLTHPEVAFLDRYNGSGHTVTVNHTVDIPVSSPGTKKEPGQFDVRRDADNDGRGRWGWDDTAGVVVSYFDQARLTSTDEK